MWLPAFVWDRRRRGTGYCLHCPVYLLRAQVLYNLKRCIYNQGCKKSWLLHVTLWHTLRHRCLHNIHVVGQIASDTKLVLMSILCCCPNMLTFISAIGWIYLSNSELSIFLARRGPLKAIEKVFAGNAQKHSVWCARISVRGYGPWWFSITSLSMQAPPNCTPLLGQTTWEHGSTSLKEAAPGITIKNLFFLTRSLMSLPLSYSRCDTLKDEAVLSSWSGS